MESKELVASGGNELTVSEFSGEIQKGILDKMNLEYLTTGKFFKDQMSVSPKVWSSLVVSGGVVGTVASSAMSSKLFMATAPVSSLMKLNSGGLSSAVMGPGGIMKHAGFLPVSGSFSVVAPLMAMQALTTVAMLQQLSAMDKKLDAIKGSIDKMMARQEATKVAELFAAVRVVDEIYAQYGQAGRFSTDMLIRLALAERDAAILSRRYEMLENASDADANGFDSYDTYCTMLASFLNLRVKHLRTCVDVQENPQFVQRSSEGFRTLLKDNITLWDALLNKSEAMKKDIEEAEAQRVNAKGLQKIAQLAGVKELDRKKDKYHATVENERAIMKDFLILVDSAKQLSETADTQGLPTMLYWHDGEGEHCIATNEQVLLAA